MPRNSSRAQLRQGHVCGPCSLCRQEKFNYSHAADLGREEKDRLIQHGKNIRDLACICKTCVNDIRRNLTKCDYIPRWVKVTFAKLKCTVPKCTSKSRVVQCLLATKDHIHALLKIPNTPSNSDVDQVYLCLEHYKIIHRSLPENRDQYDHSRHQCTLCRKVIPSVRDHRHCPNPQIINEHLKNHTDFDGDLDSTAIICRTCFICHQIILKSREKDSLDSELLILVDKLKQDMMGITISGLDSIVEYSLLSSAIALGDNLLNQWPMFLPEVYKSFCGTFNEMSNHHNMSINVSPENVVSSRYLLSYLVTKLDKHLVYTMKQRSAGILLYRKGADLLLILTKILHRQRPCSCNQATTNVCTISSDKGCDDRHGSASVLAWEEMNKTLHEQIDKNKGSMQGEMFNISTFDVDHWIDIMDKNILKMLAVMTKTKRDKNMHCNEVYEDMMKSHSKKLRCFNIACIILFCTNSECNFPMHILLTDTIESFGGSTELVRILNRLGVVASKDTHARYIEHVVTRYQEGSHIRQLRPHGFTIASLDNLDFQASYVAVYCGDQHRSTHVTTIQVVQPKPLSLCDSSEIHKSTSSQRSQRNTSPSGQLLPLSPFTSAHSRPLSLFQSTSADMCPQSRPLSLSQSTSADMCPQSRPLSLSRSTSADMCPQSRPLSLSQSTSADMCPLSRPLSLSQSTSADMCPLSQPLSLSQSTSAHSRPLSLSQSTSADMCPQSRPLSLFQSTSADMCPLSQPLSLSQSTSADMCPQSRPLSLSQSTSADMCPLSQPLSLSQSTSAHSRPLSLSQFELHLQPPRFVTPGDIGQLEKGLKRVNVDNTCDIPRKLKHRARTAKEKKGTPTNQTVLPLLNEIEQC